MASERDSQQYVELSKVRTGYKREFQFALKSQFETGWLSRFRVRKRVDVSDSASASKRTAVVVVESESEVEEQAKSDVVDLTSDGESNDGNECVILRETGLEGLNITHNRETKIVTPTQFGLHADSDSVCPADNFYLENQSTSKSVLNACKHAKVDNVTASIRTTISSSSEQKSALCSGSGEPISDANTDRMTVLCHSSSDFTVSPATPKLSSDNGEGTHRSVQRVSQQRSRNSAPKANTSSTKIEGQITRKDLGLHKLVFQGDVLPDKTELGYYFLGQKLQSGFKKGSGICCACCNTVVSPSVFESHAGCAFRRKPYHQIYTSNGMSLHEISVKLSKEREISTTDNDDLCTVCKDPGDLLCCDGCPRVFHTYCVSLSSVPVDKWYCKVCVRNFQIERCAEQNPNATAAGRIPGVDPMKQITNHCIRIVKILDTQDGGCALCRTQDLCNSGFGPRTFIVCDQCEKEYHVGCIREHSNRQDLEELPIGDWFCSSDCERVNTALGDLLQQRDQKLPFELVHAVKKKVTAEECGGDDLDISWRILHGTKSCIEEILPLLAKAVSVFHEQFAHIWYGKQDLIPHMVYGRNVKETEFGGMHCAVLSVNSTIVSVGVFRVFSKKVAEIPLVATSEDCKGKGYFRCLYTCLENFLKELGVKNLLLPSAEETRSLWVNRFGFGEIPQQELRDLKRDYPLMVFDGTSMLRKVVTDPST